MDVKPFAISISKSECLKKKLTEKHNFHRH